MAMVGKVVVTAHTEFPTGPSDDVVEVVSRRLADRLAQLVERALTPVECDGDETAQATEPLHS